MVYRQGLVGEAFFVSWRKLLQNKYSTNKASNNNKIEEAFSAKVSVQTLREIKQNTTKGKRLKAFFLSVSRRRCSIHDS